MILWVPNNGKVVTKQKTNRMKNVVFIFHITSSLETIEEPAWLSPFVSFLPACISKLCYFIVFAESCKGAPSIKIASRLKNKFEMSRMISSALKDSIKTEKYDLSDDMSICDNRKDVPSDESNLGFFRKIVLNKGKQSKGKRVEEELSESVRNQLRFSAMHFQQYVYASRPSTLLEKHLLPVLESSAKLPVSSEESKTAKPQLTIFYNGTINVYDNVSADQAQTIFLLAGGATVSPPIVTNTPKVDIAKAQKDKRLDKTSSICKLQADLPLARTISLQHFLEKRRKRIMNKSPYPAPSSSTTRHEVNKEHDQLKLHINNIGDSNEAKSFSNFPFPSRGYF